MPSTILLSDNGASSGSAGLKQTAGNDGVLILQTTTSGGTATNAVYVDNKQIVGFGVTPSAWDSSIFTPLQVRGASFFAGVNSPSDAWVGSNFYYGSGAYKYIATGNASYYRQASGEHYWGYAGSGAAGNSITFTQGMMLSVNGQLGLVGTTSPTNSIDIQGTAGTPNVGITINNNSGGSYGGLTLTRGGSSQTYLSCGGIDGYINAYGGNLSIGTTTVAQTLSTNHYLTLKNTSGTPWGVGPTSSYGSFYITNGGVGVYLSNGGTSWTSYSDERVKDIIEPITGAADKVSTLRAVIGKYKTDQDGVRRPFLIAQDVQAVLPEAVNVQGEGDDTLGLQYTDVIPLLVAAIKELKAELDTAKEQIAILQGAQQ